MPKKPTVTLSSKATTKKVITKKASTGPLPGMFGEYADFLKSIKKEQKPDVPEKKRVLYKLKKGDKIKMKKGLYKGKEAMVKRRLLDGSVVVSFETVQKDVVLTPKELEMNTMVMEDLKKDETLITPASYYKSLIDASLHIQ